MGPRTMLERLFKLDATGWERLKGGEGRLTRPLLIAETGGHGQHSEAPSKNGRKRLQVVPRTKAELERERTKAEMQCVQAQLAGTKAELERERTSAAGTKAEVERVRGDARLELEAAEALELEVAAWTAGVLAQLCANPRMGLVGGHAEARSAAQALLAMAGAAGQTDEDDEQSVRAILRENAACAVAALACAGCGALPSACCSALASVGF